MSRHRPTPHPLSPRRHRRPATVPSPRHPPCPRVPPKTHRRDWGVLVALTWPGGRRWPAGSGVRWPHTGLAWPVGSATSRDGAERPSEAEGGPQPLSGSLEAETTTEKGKKIKKIKNFGVFFFFFSLYFFSFPFLAKNQRVLEHHHSRSRSHTALGGERGSVGTSPRGSWARCPPGGGVCRDPRPPRQWGQPCPPHGRCRRERMGSVAAPRELRAHLQLLPHTRRGHPWVRDLIRGVPQDPGGSRGDPPGEGL